MKKLTLLILTLLLVCVFFFVRRTADVETGEAMCDEAYDLDSAYIDEYMAAEETFECDTFSGEALS